MPIYKLGCQPRKIDPRTLRFARYLSATTPPPPPSVNWGAKLGAIGMMLNDRMGCCTIASLGHAKQVMTAANGNEVTVADAAILDGYVTITGAEGAAYNPSTGQNDNGANELDVLNHYRQQGFFGEKLDAYAAVTQTSQREVMDSIHLMGGCYLGVALPIAWQNAAVWDVPQQISIFSRREWQPGSWGGHAVYSHAYDAAGVEVTTWGGKMKMTWRAFFTYVQEAYALYKRSDWLNANRTAPNGFDDTALMSDVTALGGQAPPPMPPLTPPPGPTDWHMQSLQLFGAAVGYEAHTPARVGDPLSFSVRVG